MGGSFQSVGEFVKKTWGGGKKYRGGLGSG